DAFEDIWRCMNQALAEFGLGPLSIERVKSGVGDGAENLVRRCLGEADAPLVPRVLPRYMHYYSGNPNPTVRLYPGVAEALRRVRALGVKQGILTNKPEEVTRKSCDALGLTPLVDLIRGARDGGPLKPDPESLLGIVRHFDLDPRECAMVGDYRADY